jgi:hypothetical protein
VGAESLQEIVREPIEGPIYYQATRVADEAQLEVAQDDLMGDQMLEELK